MNGGAWHCSALGGLLALLTTRMVWRQVVPSAALWTSSTIVLVACVFPSPRCKHAFIVTLFIQETSSHIRSCCRRGEVMIFAHDFLVLISLPREGGGRFSGWVLVKTIHHR